MFPRGAPDGIGSPAVERHLFGDQLPMAMSAFAGKADQYGRDQLANNPANIPQRDKHLTSLGDWKCNG